MVTRTLRPQIYCNKGMKFKCQQCGIEYQVPLSSSATKFCTRECYGDSKRKSPKPSKVRKKLRWRIDTRGYLWVRTKKGWRLYHRYITEKRIGRSLTSDEVIHHKNRNRLDNRKSNLQITNQGEHSTIHRGDRWPNLDWLDTCLYREEIRRESVKYKFLTDKRT